MPATIEFNQFASSVKAVHEQLPAKPPIKEKRSAQPNVPETPQNIAFLKEILNHLDPDPTDHGTRTGWRNQIWAIADLDWTCGYVIAHEYSIRGDLFNKSDFDGVWNSFNHQKGITYRSLFHFAAEAGYKGPKNFPDTQNPPAPFKPKKLPGLVTISADKIAAEPVNWLVENCFPLGMIGVIGGNPGMGKSQIAIKLAALATSGSGSPLQKRVSPTGSVIILANEDDAARTIRPRLEAAGAILNKVHIVQGVAKEDEEVEPFQLDYDVASLRSRAEQLGDVRLIIIDPPNAYISGKSDTHKDSDVRKLLAPLQSLANDTGALILLVAHLNKRNDTSAQQKFNGSTAWVAVSRVAYIVTEDEDEGIRYMVPVKNNIGDDRMGFTYEIQEKLISSENGEIKTSSIKWLSKTDRRADEILNKKRKNQETVIEQVCEFMQEELLKGPKDANEVLEKARSIGFSDSTINRAKKTLNIESTKEGKIWKWHLKESNYKPPPF
jgi:putative DNA primase/helicase